MCDTSITSISAEDAIFSTLQAIDVMPLSQSPYLECDLEGQVREILQDAQLLNTSTSNKSLFSESWEEQASDESQASPITRVSVIQSPLQEYINTSGSTNGKSPYQEVNSWDEINYELEAISEQLSVYSNNDSTTDIYYTRTGLRQDGEEEAPGSYVGTYFNTPVFDKYPRWGSKTRKAWEKVKPVSPIAYNPEVKQEAEAMESEESAGLEESEDLKELDVSMDTLSLGDKSIEYDEDGEVNKSTETSGVCTEEANGDGVKYLDLSFIYEEATLNFQEEDLEDSY